MKKALLLAILLGSHLSAFAQGKIIFKNFGIQNSDATGTYNVPILYFGQGLGLARGGATLGLFLPGSSVPFATSQFGTTANTAPWAVSPASQTVSVPGQPPGSRAVIVIRAWAGPQWPCSSYSPWAEWVLTTRPLGGIPPDGGPEIIPPCLTGWGPEDGSGLTTGAIPRASTVVSDPANGAVYAAPAAIQIGVRYGGDPGYFATNLTVYVGPILVASEVPPPPDSKGLTFLTPPLGPGSYSLYSVLTGGYPEENFISTSTSDPITITVVDPVDIVLTPPATANGQLTFQYSVNPGLSYVVQHSDDLLTWQGIETNKPPSSPAAFWRPIANGPSGYYRVERLPNP